MRRSVRCSACYSRRRRRATVGSCVRCAKQRPIIDPAGRCDFCVYVLRPRPVKIAPACVACGEQRPILAHGHCNRCLLKRREGTWTYAEGLAARLGASAPEWFGDFGVHVADRYSPSEARLRLRELGRLLSLTADPCGLIAAATRANGNLTPLGWTLEEFLSLRGLVRSAGDAGARATRRRSRIIAGVPEALRDAVERFAATELANQRRAERVGARPRAEQTLRIHLEVIADFARENEALGDWASVAASDVEAFLAKRSPKGTHLLPSLRAFFAWARSVKLVLVNPTRDLRSTARRRFSGSVLDRPAQRRLFRRWTSEDGIDANEALVGLLTLLHGASVDELRHLELGDINKLEHSLAFRRRAHDVPLDPRTWAALERVLARRDALHTVNSHVLVNRRTKVTAQPVARGYPRDLLAALGVTPSELRCCRIAQLVSTTDAVLVSELFGMTNYGVEYYMAEQVDQGRLSNL